MTLPPVAQEGAGGGLLVSNSTLTIQGAGPGLTIINANFPAGEADRIFHVANGANLTLEGLTIEAGNAFLDSEYVSANRDVTRGQYVLIAVTDTGTGMTPEIVQQKRIFA